MTGSIDGDVVAGRASDASWFDERLADLSDRAHVALAELQSQDLHEIDVADRIHWLPRIALDWLHDR